MEVKHQTDMSERYKVAEEKGRRKWGEEEDTRYKLKIRQGRGSAEKEERRGA